MRDKFLIRLVNIENLHRDTFINCALVRVLLGICEIEHTASFGVPAIIVISSPCMQLRLYVIFETMHPIFHDTYHQSLTTM